MSYSQRLISAESHYISSRYCVSAGPISDSRFMSSRMGLMYKLSGFLAPACGRAGSRPSLSCEKPNVLAGVLDSSSSGFFSPAFRRYSVQRTRLRHAKWAAPRRSLTACAGKTAADRTKTPPSPHWRAVAWIHLLKTVVFSRHEQEATGAVQKRWTLYGVCWPR